VRFASAPARFRGPAPLLGQHTADVLERVLGMSRAETDALARRGIVRQADAQEMRA
jgi:crotonobetainyl-CoA:carnitine CoA-transferase CaiB-like acyl-CoA transferase